VLAVPNGAYTYTGINVGLYYNRIMTNSAGAYTYTGKDVTLTYSPASGGVTLPVTAGTYVMTGSPVNLIKRKRKGDPRLSRRGIRYP